MRSVFGVFWGRARRLFSGCERMRSVSGVCYVFRVVLGRCFFIVRAVRRTIPTFLTKVNRANPNFVIFCLPVLCAAAASRARRLFSGCDKRNNVICALMLCFQGVLTMLCFLFVPQCYIVTLLCLYTVKSSVTFLGAKLQKKCLCYTTHRCKSLILKHCYMLRFFLKMYGRPPIWKKRNGHQAQFAPHVSMWRASHIYS